MRTIMLCLLPKASGGWRLIGLLNTVYRLWARLRSPISAAWFGALGRDYLAFGQGKAADDAAFEIALEAEASGEAGTSITTVGDLEKGFDMESHSRAISAGAKHG